MRKGIVIGIGVGIAIIFVVMAFSSYQIPSDENVVADSDVETIPTAEPGKTFTLKLSDGAGTTDGNP